VTTLDVADLVVIAGRTLGIGTDAALAQADIAAAHAALAEARPGGPEPGAAFPDAAAAAAAGVGLVHALLRHRPFPGHDGQVAVAAGLQFLSLNGWRADLDPPAVAAVVVEALASGRLPPAGAAAWLSPRLSPRPAPRARLAPVRLPRPSLRPLRALPVAGLLAGGRMLMSAGLAIAVGGLALLATACSPGPGSSAAHPGGQPPAVRQSSGTQASELAYAACMRAHGIGDFPGPPVGGVIVGTDLSSLTFRSVEYACQGK
jgi:hypothetical protein